MSTSIKVEGKTALISGANRGIGRAIAVGLLKHGASKVYAGARKVETLSDLKAEYGDRLVPVKLDVTDGHDIEEVSQLATDVDILINNAGVGNFGGFFDPNYKESTQQNYAVNVFGLINLSHAMINHLTSKPEAAIVNLSSVAGLGNMPVVGTYSSSKAAVHSITQGMRGELASKNILVSAVYPGPIDTDMAADFPMEKASPESLAEEVIEALANGVEDIFPDPMSRQVGEGYASAPKAIEQQFAGFVGEPAQ